MGEAVARRQSVKQHFLTYRKPEQVVPLIKPSPPLRPSCVLAVAGLVTLLVLVTGMSPSAVAQEADSLSSADPSTTYGWMGYEIGPTASGGAVASLGLVNHVQPPHLFHARLFSEISGAAEAPLSGRPFHGGIEVLYGRTTTWRLGRASLATGLSLGGEGPSFAIFGEPNIRTVVGLPVEASIHLVPPRFDVVGLKLGARANLNPERSFVGLSAGLVVGSIR